MNTLSFLNSIMGSRYLQENQNVLVIENNGNIEDTLIDQNKESIRHGHSNLLFLLVIDLIVFVALFFLSYNSLKSLKKKLDRENDPKFKIVNGLIAANGIRALSLVIVILLENDSGDSPKAWINYLAHVVPSMMFVSGYMALVTLLADYYYTVKDETNHVVILSLRIVIVLGYVLVAAIALFSFVFKSFKSFMYNSEFIIGLVYIITASMIIYYGQLIGNFFQELNKYENSTLHFKVSQYTKHLLSYQYIYIL